jgi:arylsulfatase A-like enzyme
MKIFSASGRRFEFFSAAIISFALPVVELVSKFITKTTGEGKVLPSVTSSLHESNATLLGLIGFTLALVVVHVVFFLATWHFWLAVCRRFPPKPSQRLILCVLFFLYIQAYLLSLNMIFYPKSSFFELALPYLFSYSGTILLVLLSTLLLFSMDFKGLLSRFFHKRWKYTAAVAIIALPAGVLWQNAGVATTAQNAQPDVIFIGLDSLRPDHIGAASGSPSLTPALDLFLAQSWMAERAYTPLARTFPSWMSILSGRYPFEHGGRYNLIDPQLINRLDANLPNVLRQQGYTTAYAIDETRFSNIDSAYGFDWTLTPKIGGVEFLLTFVGDMPVVNLLSRSALYDFLFPYQYMNRAAHVVYDPSLFSARLDKMIEGIDPRRPLFLAVHFELPHWPYSWRDSKTHEIPASGHLIDRSPPSYQAAVNRTDQQFHQLIDSLQRNGRLNNAIVVVLSDHGENFSLYATSSKPASPEHALILPPYMMHGVNVVDEKQTNVVLAVRTFGSALPDSRKFDAHLTSLVDIAPTVLDLLQIPADAMSTTGCAISAQGSACQNGRVVFIESGFYVDAMFNNTIFDEKAVAAEARQYYEIDETGRLVMKSEFMEELIGKKQRAAISGNWILAYLPFEGRKQFLFGDIRNSLYWNAELDTAWRDNPEAINIFQSFCKTYAADSKDVADFCMRHG